MVVPQNTPKWSFSVGKPMVFWYHHFRKPQYLYITDHWFSMHTKMAWGTTVRQTQRSLLVQVRLEEPRVFASAKWKWLEAQIKLKISINCIWFWGEQTSQLETIGNWPQQGRQGRQIKEHAQKQPTFWAAKLRLVSWSTPVLNWPAGRRLRFTDGLWW